jgi:hypothetical protein
MNKLKKKIIHKALCKKVRDKSCEIGKAWALSKKPLKAERAFEDAKRELDEFEEKYCNEQQ